MSKLILVFFLFFITDVLAKEINIWKLQYFYSLEKDEFASIRITNNSNKKSYLLKFRWTLYDGSENLTVLLNYRGYPYQYILKNERMRNSIKIPFLSRKSRAIVDCYILIIFTDFNIKNKTANFNIYVKDIKNRILVKFNKRN